MKQKLILAHFFSEAIDCVKHFAIDVSSGIESAPGIKDERKMREFVEVALNWMKPRATL